MPSRYATSINVTDVFGKKSRIVAFVYVASTKTYFGESNTFLNGEHVHLEDDGKRGELIGFGVHMRFREKNRNNTNGMYVQFLEEGVRLLKERGYFANQERNLPIPWPPLPVNQAK